MKKKKRKRSTKNDDEHKVKKRKVVQLKASTFNFGREARVKNIVNTVVDRICENLEKNYTKSVSSLKKEITLYNTTPQDKGDNIIFRSSRIQGRIIDKINELEMFSGFVYEWRHEMRGKRRTGKMSLVVLARGPNYFD